MAENKKDAGLTLAVSAVTSEEDFKRLWKRDAAEMMHTALVRLLSSTSNREAIQAVAYAKEALRYADTGIKGN
jgi:hypothetical protein